ncbi:hypothetical protein [Roseobacter sp. HKCCA0434]|uniref:hypothetical protein n=1 Tax=Roseobacter sp. HKCCA0434 TaxID=3079297 RepID=UPI002905E963|nr:hypothetical protein [Roseobacter sp. HKCCA0434]
MQSDRLSGVLMAVLVGIEFSLLVLLPLWAAESLAGIAAPASNIILCLGGIAAAIASWPLCRRLIAVSDRDA